MTTEGDFVDLLNWIEARRLEIEVVLQTRLPARAPGDDPGRLVESMRYSLLAPGKRLRPLLALAAAEAVGAPHGSEPRRSTTDGAPDRTVLAAAVSVELIHCYSLVHDDLPAMDDDDLRRGKPSNHKVYGEATAILAGDALLTLAFEWLAEAGEQSGRPADFGRAALALARGAGMNGMVRGQARDLGEPAPTEFSTLERLHEEKTGALFRAAAEVGAAAMGATQRQIAVVGAFGHRFGIAFQHADDREDGDHRIWAERTQGRIGLLLTEAVNELTGLSGTGRGAMLRALAEQLRMRVERGPAPPSATESPPSGR